MNKVPVLVGAPGAGGIGTGPMPSLLWCSPQVLCQLAHTWAHSSPGLGECHDLLVSSSLSKLDGSDLVLFSFPFRDWPLGSVSCTWWVLKLVSLSPMGLPALYGATMVCTKAMGKSFFFFWTPWCVIYRCGVPNQSWLRVHVWCGPSWLWGVLCPSLPSMCSACCTPLEVPLVTDVHQQQVWIKSCKLIAVR